MAKEPREPKMITQIRDAIRESGVTLLELGKQTGVDHGRLSRFLHGHRTLTLPAAARVCEVLGLELTKPAEREPRSSNRKKGK
jgi:transcriptional regulator with XRE-family HTH domain